MPGTPGATSIQFESIARITGGDPGMMREMLDLFLRLAPESLRRMKEQLELQAWETLAREAHKFKPSTMYMGMVAVYKNLELVEEMARGNPDREALSRLIKDIDAECAFAFPELRLLQDELTC
ncbi:MAG: hypothetical protein A3H91_09770 [Gammaproteobacteria bacterium RIFCSPLOWO2_02_FULL_61_13]|nr:MAG: hypothetical protein A3H91_09770 [Gammaproteobacteria bacterium RIFCSPLOWO2_02_FULL_61_13]